MYGRLPADAAPGLVLGGLGSHEPVGRKDENTLCVTCHKRMCQIVRTIYLWSTGSQTMLCGSCFIQLRKWRA